MKKSIKFYGKSFVFFIKKQYIWIKQLFKNNNENKIDEIMPVTGCTTNTRYIMGVDPCKSEVETYKKQRDDKLKTFKANKEQAKKTKEQKELEAKEREWIKDIIKIAKQDTNGKTT
jgi:hypothetical protein